MMNPDIWHELMHLESRDYVERWFVQIHGRKLNARRAKEISASARQGREYFVSAAAASLTVRPLLSYYGLLSLCRALTLLKAKTAGEESLSSGHGIETVDWKGTLSGDISGALSSMENLKVRFCKGFLGDLHKNTNYERGLYIYDNVRDFTIPNDSFYPLEGGLTLTNILERLPDLFYRRSLRENRGIQVSSLNYSEVDGVRIIVRASLNHPVCVEYERGGYKLEVYDDPYSDQERAQLSCSTEHFLDNFPAIYSARVIRTIGGNSAPYLVQKFDGLHDLSELVLTYVISYIMAMLARYFPTQWSALIAGEKGDRIWPELSYAQRYVETALPELIMENIYTSIRVARNRSET